MASQKHILVIGAGVIGLQTAITLLEAGFGVTVLGRHLPGDISTEYTSPWAGAIWRSNALLHEKELQEWDAESYAVWLDNVKNNPSEAEDAGILQVPMRLLWTGPHEYIPNGPMSIWYANRVDNFHEIPPSALRAPFVSGATHDGIAVNAPRYLSSLQRKVQGLGGRVLKAELPSSGGLSQALRLAGRIARAYGVASPIHAFVNASGLGARTLVPDPDVYPIRGQTVTVAGQSNSITTMFYPEANASIAPRLGYGVSILGSTYQEGDENPHPDPAITRRITERCKSLAPELLNEAGGFDIVSVNVGFRPGRRGGPRVEIENLQTADGEKIVCHCYGSAGGGFQNSFGSARKVLALLSERLQTGAGHQAKL
ncbi:hypothetical protein F4778DRAFT_542831 [Xylariomycetidae sp. FL2044]|nr:hypothetical protein F4778DRAFT_542831 [Xylariomycetidae sp. FL2044]